MKKTKLISVIGATVFLMISSDSFSQANECRPIEFAELESMNSNELETKYCQIKRIENSNYELAEINRTGAIGMMALQNTVESNMYGAKATAHSNAASACHEESKRVLRILEKKVKKTVSPICP